MPVYEYVCEQCEQDHELLVEAHARDTQSCPCGGVLKRRFSQVHAAPVPGISNRINRSWRETGRDVTSRLDRTMGESR